ncbi:hypothetical protein O181_023232 [Austropuccinia psidii MF-1]|uniref:Uncharacterized protein n=1 Tax=Austropuccinia psidii MF-1 TaxID=1389203 RepID=A0A9Q3CH12_9BASI|nr:hypothetical protein [Austropuccinia psidii MF-1]
MRRSSGINVYGSKRQTGRQKGILVQQSPWHFPAYAASGAGLGLSPFIAERANPPKEVEECEILRTGTSPVVTVLKKLNQALSACGLRRSPMKSIDSSNRSSNYKLCFVICFRPLSNGAQNPGDIFSYQNYYSEIATSLWNATEMIIASFLTEDAYLTKKLASNAKLAN